MDLFYAFPVYAFPDAQGIRLGRGAEKKYLLKMIMHPTSKPVDNNPVGG
jgi:hypothetical protein